MRKYALLVWVFGLVFFNILMTESKFGDFFGGGGVLSSEDLRNKAKKHQTMAFSFEDSFRGILHSNCELCCKT